MAYMQIKLTGIPVYYINLDSQKARGLQTKNLLHSLGFHSIRRVPGFNHENHVIGCAMAHLNALKSLVESKHPFILVEDDIEITHFDHILEVPDNIDALYLGVSKMGAIENAHKELLIVDKVEENENLYRIYNMLSAHAIVYFNMDYVEKVIKEIEKCLNYLIPVDIAMANKMIEGNVYALDRPMFIQKNKFRDFTDTPISKLNNLMLRSK
jgi:GR25 family glycosyltransferase involved in LPS biosynthesis